MPWRATWRAWKFQDSGTGTVVTTRELAAMVAIASCRLLSGGVGFFFFFLVDSRSQARQQHWCAAKTQQCPLCVVILVSTRDIPGIRARAREHGWVTDGPRELTANKTNLSVHLPPVHPFSPLTFLSDATKCLAYRPNWTLNCPSGWAKEKNLMNRGSLFCAFQHPPVELGTNVMQVGGMGSLKGRRPETDSLFLYL